MERLGWIIREAIQLIMSLGHVYEGVSVIHECTPGSRRTRRSRVRSSKYDVYGLSGQAERRSLGAILGGSRTEWSNQDYGKCDSDQTRPEALLNAYSATRLQGTVYRGYGDSSQSSRRR